MAVKYLSNRLKNLNVGISNYSEDKTSVIVTGHVGIGTDDATAQVSVANTSILAVGIITAYQLYSTLYGEFKGGGVTADNIVGTSLSISGISTVGGLLDANGGLDVSGGSGLVASTAKVSDLTSGRVTYAGASGELQDNANLTFDGTDITVASAVVSDLTDNRLVIAGTSGALEDSSKLTFDGSTLAVTGDATFSGNVSIAGTLTKEDVTNIDSVGLITARSGVRITAGGLVVTAGVSTFAADIKANGNIVGDSSTNITGIAGVTASTLTGTLQTAAQTNITSLGTLSAVTVSGDITANGNIVGDNSTNISGINSVTATTFYGSGVNLTALNASNLGSGTVPDARFPATLPAASGVNLTALNASNLGSGTVPDARFPATLPAISGANLTNLPTGINTTGTSTFEDITVNGNAGIGSLNVTGVSTFAGNINANGNIVGDSSTNITGIAGVTASTLTGTLQTAAQTNITSLGTLSAVTVSGDITANGNIVGDDSTNISGINSVTATSFYGDGSNLTGTGGETLIAGITVKEESSTVGTAGSIKVLDFRGANITATASGSDTSVITVTRGGLWESNATGIHTLTNVGIGTTNSTSKLYVVGDAYITGVITATAGAGIASATLLTDAGIDPDGTSTFLNVNITGIATAADFNSSSDIKLKTNVQRISDPLDKIIRIEGVSFNWKKDNSPSIGVIANELEKVLPQLVTDSDPKAVNYNGLIGVLIEAVKEQQSEIDSLKERISKLE